MPPLHRTIPLLLATLLPIFAGCHRQEQLDRQTVDLSGSEWKLWQDKSAAWGNDELFLPPADLSKVPTNAPTGGWESLAQGIPVSVPGTAEEFLGKGLGPESMVKGVTWWVREFTMPEGTDGKKVRLLFDSVRLRAEVYVNHKLVAYDLVGNTPFEADLTGVLKPGEKVQVAVRVTNPGGNFDWKDVDPFAWGKYLIPLGHGFSGVTGGVHLVVSDPVYIDNLYIQNTPKKTEVTVIATVKNTTDTTAKGDMQLVIKEKISGVVILQKKLSDLSFQSGENQISAPLSIPDAKLWDLDHPNLYMAEATIVLNQKPVDTLVQSFGLRWFAPEGEGADAMLRLNGKRTVLRTAISWGFWPINGVFPSPKLAEKQIEVAKAYGLNMLNFHRCIGNPIVFEKADEMGLLYFEEPGGYVSGKDDPFAQALSREKLLRMVKRDRNHPSLVIYNMINEQWDKWGAATNSALFALHRRDLQDAHAIDPSRTILYTSAWAGRAADPQNDPAKMHMLPFDSNVHMSGWSDFHRAGGPDVWRQEFYKDPTHHYGYTTNMTEVVYWGEEGAVSAPPRLGLIEDSLKDAPHLGWDGQVYRDWYSSFDSYLTTNNLRAAFPTVDDLCKAMGVVSIEHQGRKIEDARVCNATDGYAINGWESELIDNHSGVVDCFRNPKADPAILAYYNQPLYVAVKPRQQISTFPGSIPVDFYLINEKNLKGPLTLKIRGTTPDGTETFSKDLPFNASGGDVYGELIAEAVNIPIEHQAGFTTVTATLIDGHGAEKATGHDQLFGAEWKSIALGGSGAVYENGSVIHDFLKTSKGVDVPAFDNIQSKLDWLIVAKAATKEPIPVTAVSLLTPDGRPGLKTLFYDAKDLTKPLLERVDSSLDFKVPSGASPDAKFPLIENYTVVWEGTLVPPADGEYSFSFKFRNGARLWIDGKKLVDLEIPRHNQNKEFKLTMIGGKPVPIRVELLQKNDDATMQLCWQTPVAEKVTPEQVLARAARDGTTVIVLDRAETWLDAIGRATSIPQGKSFVLGGSWLGGQYFVKNHPLFDGLPVNCALNWTYQSVVGGKRTALEVNGGELIAGAYHTWPMKLGSAVSILSVGKGRLILSALDIVPQLSSPDSTAEVAKKLFCNFIHYATPSAK